MLLSLALFAAVPAVQDAAPSQKPKKEMRICRRLGTTGSRMDERRVCKTKAEWAQIDAANNVHGIDANHTGEVERNRGK